MAEFNEKEILKGYKTFFVWLLVASLLINAVTLFVPIFYINELGGIISGSEMGIKFMGIDVIIDEVDEYRERFGEDYRKYLSEPYKVYTSENSYTIYEKNTNLKDTLDVDSDFFDIIDKDTFIWKQVIRVVLSIMIIAILLSALCLISFALSSSSSINERLRVENVDNGMLANDLLAYKQNITCNFWLNTVYFLVSLFACWGLFNDWELEGVMTFTFIPWIAHLAVYIGCLVLMNHLRMVLKGEVAPIGGRHLGYAVAGSQRDTEVDKVELLMKYKEMLDNGIITQEEYDAKKKDLL